MSKYHGFLELRVKNPALTPVILWGLQDIYPLREDDHHPGRLSAFNERRSLEDVAKALLVCEQVVEAELTRRHESEQGLHVPFFSIDVTVWESEPGVWRDQKSVTPIPGFPNCKLSGLWVCDSFSAEETTHDSDTSGRVGTPHDAINLRQEYSGTTGRTSGRQSRQARLASFLLDEKNVAEVFSCFALYRRNGGQ